MAFQGGSVKKNVDGDKGYKKMRDGKKMQFGKNNGSGRVIKDSGRRNILQVQRMKGMLSMSTKRKDCP